MADFGFGVPDEIERLSLDRQSDPPPPPPPPAGDIRAAGTVTVDITDKFSQAVKTLAPGELVKDGLFTLFESVAALEIMDPKMDSGCVQSEDDLEESYDVSRPLTPEEVVGIIDQLLCHEMAWHLGYPLSQTLFTSVYVESLLMPQPRSLAEARFARHRTEAPGANPMLEILKTYCLGMLKACGFVNDRIRSEHFYEEEDFVTNTYNRDLLVHIPSETIQAALLEARNLVSSLSGTLGQDMARALDARLQLRYLFLKAIESPQHMRHPEIAREPWKAATVIIPDIGKTHSMGRPVDEAFSAKLQRKLASTMPPRPIVQIGFDDAFGHLTRLFNDGSELMDVLNYTNSQCLQTFVCTFQAKKPQPLVFVRTLLQTFLFYEMEILGSMSIRQLMDDDFSIVSMPANIRLDRANDEIEAVQDPRFIMSQQLELFRQRAAQPFLDVLRTFCQNRCRVRRTLCHIIRDWETLQVEAEDVDELLQIKTKETPLKLMVNGTTVETYSLPLSSWTYLTKLRLMEWIVQLGFELEVYQPDEYAGMYWYLNYLADWREQHLKRLDAIITARAREYLNAKLLDPTAQLQLDRSMSFIALQRLEAAVTWRLSYSLSTLYVVLTRLGLLKVPPRPLSSDQFRYELRMRPFAPIGLPSLPSFDEFRTGTSQPGTPTPDLLQYAERANAGAKDGFEQLSSRFNEEKSFSAGSYDRWLASTKNGLRSCIMTGIAISAVQKALQSLPEAGVLNIKAEVPTPDKCYHSWWIVPKIVRT